MAPPWFMARLARSIACATLPAALAAVGSAQILTVDDLTLTNYRAGSTAVQGVRPQHLQRIVNVEGSQRASGGIPAAIAGNPGENAWRGTTSLNGVVLATGSYSPTDVDISLPTKGFAWVVGRAYSAVQKNSSGSAMDSNGYQGQNWFQISQPEIVLYDDSDNSKDTLYLVLGPDRFAEFRRVSESSTQFSGRNGATGCFKFIQALGQGEADLYVLTDTRGTEFSFFGFNSYAGAAKGCLWKIVDADNNATYVGDFSNKGNAITNGYDSAGRIKNAFDGSDRRFTYSYTELDSVWRLTQVKAETKSGGTWGAPTGVATVAQVDYAYYTTAGAESWGESGDLKMVTLTKYLSDGTTTQTSKKHYRYWEGTYDGTGSPGNPGYPHALKYVYDSEGLRRFDWTDNIFNESFLAATEESLKPYAAAFFEYDSSHRVREAWFNGSCGCSGGTGSGTTELTYGTFTLSPATDGYDVGIAMRTVVKRPDGSYLTQYFDEAGQGLSQVITSSDPAGSSPPAWATRVTRNSTGCVTLVATPEAATAYSHSTGAITFAASAGLVQYFVRDTSTDTVGFLSERRHGIGCGTNGDGTNANQPPVTQYLDEKLTYNASTLSKTITDVTVRRAVVTSRKVYSAETSTDTGGEETTYAYTAWSGASLSPEKIDVTPPIVSTTKNGSGSAIVSSSHLRKDGLVDFEKRPFGSSYTIAFTAYTNGQVTRRIEDASTASTEVTSLSSVPSAFSSAGSSELHKKVDTTYTASGLRDTVTPAGTGQKVEKSYFTKLADERLVALDYASYDGTDYHGPVQYRVINQAGKTEVSAVIAVSGNKTSTAQSAHIVEGDTDATTPSVVDADPIQAVGSSFGAVAQMTTFVFDETGTQLEQERRYFLVPSSAEGTPGTNYDKTVYGYDDEGHRVRVKEPSGTIRRTTYDLFGRVVDSSIGTNDAEEAGTDNMVVTEHLVYDLGASGKNGRLTSRTEYVEDGATGQRITNYLYDARGRRIVEKSPATPHALTKYDNQNRVIATGLFSDNDLEVTDDPTSRSSDRMALHETLYDEAGRAWKTIRHKIDDADGSDDDTLEALTWHDELGRAIKVDNQGALKKTRYDRLGRVTDEFVLAKDNDTAYADADDVTGDIVLEQHQTRYDPTLDTVTFTASIVRHPTDYGSGETTGELDTNADGNARKLTFGTTPDVKGRLAATGFWYDHTKRQIDRVEFGTYGNTTLDFSSGMSAPARGDDALRTTTVYNTDGTVDYVTDPRGKHAKTVHDALGRTTKEVRNCTNVTATPPPSPSGTDLNQTVLYAYANGLRTSLTADMPGSTPDQVTTYTYGTTKGTAAGDSKIATGHLLQKETYPDSTGSSDVKTFAYNAQGQRTWEKDQAGNVVEMDFDERGRMTARRVTAFGSDIDQLVKRIANTYDSLGRTSTVTQYDAASGGNVLDQVQYTYDDWGNVLKFQQDPDSTINGGGTVGTKEVSYTWSKLTVGRNTLVKTQMVNPGGDYVGFAYLTTGGLHDGEVGRVTSLFNVNQVQYARYRYAGVGQVVSTEYLEPAVNSVQYTGSGSSATYPDLDRFNRVVKSRWTKDLTGASDVDFHHTELTYDWNSNITKAEDMVHLPFSNEYVMDDLDRLKEAWEGKFDNGVLEEKFRTQVWVLGHTGNWDTNKVDLNGDLDWSDAGEENDTRAHNAVNEITTRTGGTTELTYNAAGCLTNDGVEYKYVWDAFLRLRKVLNRTNDAIVAEYKYNGLGYRIAEHTDVVSPAGVDSSDPWYYDAFDEHWRQLARYRGADSSPKEQFVPHQAGLDGRGGSSYIDLVAVRNKDADTAWTAASDGVLEERVYYCQNQHADVVALVSGAGEQVEMARYSAYGIPFGLPPGDVDSDGDCDQEDYDAIDKWTAAYDVRADLNLDGTIDATDAGMVVTDVVTGRTVLSSSTTASRRGMQGSEYCVAHCNQRNRAFTASLGAWMSRDQQGYVDGPNALAFCRSSPIEGLDPTGGWTLTVASGNSTGHDWGPITGGDTHVGPVDPPQADQKPRCSAGGCVVVQTQDAVVPSMLGLIHWKLWAPPIPLGTWTQGSPAAKATSPVDCTGRCNFDVRGRLKLVYSSGAGWSGLRDTGMRLFELQMWRYWHGTSIPGSALVRVSYPTWKGTGLGPQGGSSEPGYHVNGSVSCHSGIGTVGFISGQAAGGATVSAAIRCTCECEDSAWYR